MHLLAAVPPTTANSLYPLSVDDGTYVDDRIAQPGYAMDGLHAPKLGGDGVLHMPVKGVIWIGALMGAYGYAGHDVRYRLVTAAC